jgi:LysM repeat protein
MAATCTALLLTLTVGSGSAATHEVQPGESLWSVAKRYRTSVDQIRETNHLESDRIRVGQKLNVPILAKTAPRATTEPSPKEAPKLAPQTESASRVASTPAVKVASRASSPAAAASAKVRDDAERLYGRKAVPAPSTLDEALPEWVLEAPPAFTQFEKSSDARDGVQPCLAPDPGFGSYSKWVQVAPMAHVLSPLEPVLEPGGGFDVLVHFHGREPIRKEWVRSMQRAVLVAVDVGIDSGSYAEAFKDPRTLGQVLLAVEAELARKTGNPNAHVRHLMLSSWSAGYGAIEEILKQPFARRTVEGVILLDGLHAGYSGASLDRERLMPFIEYARSAALGERLMFVSHTSIPTPGYASTTQTARYLIWALGGKPHAVEPLVSDPMGLERLEAFNQGDFHVRGFRGNGASDHCAQLGLMRDVLRVHVLPRWQTTNLEPDSQLASLTSSSATLVQAEPLISRFATNRK